MTLSNDTLVGYFPIKTKCNGRHQMTRKRSVFQALPLKYKIPRKILRLKVKAM